MEASERETPAAAPAPMQSGLTGEEVSEELPTGNVFYYLGFELTGVAFKGLGRVAVGDEFHGKTKDGYRMRVTVRGFSEDGEYAHVDRSTSRRKQPIKTRRLLSRTSGQLAKECHSFSTRDGSPDARQSGSQRTGRARPSEDASCRRFEEVGEKR